MASIVFYTMVVIVPVLIIGLWFVKYDLTWSDENNHMQSWLFACAAIGACQIIHYFSHVRILRTAIIVAHEKDLTPLKRGFTPEEELEELDKVLKYQNDEDKEPKFDVCESATIFRGKRDLNKFRNKLKRWKHRMLRSHKSPLIPLEELKKCLNLMDRNHEMHNNPMFKAEGIFNFLSYSF